MLVSGVFVWLPVLLLRTSTAHGLSSPHCLAGPATHFELEHFSPTVHGLPPEHMLVVPKDCMIVTTP